MSVKRYAGLFSMQAVTRGLAISLVALLLGAVVQPVSAAAATPTATLCGEAGKSIVRLYRAYFNRTPDQAGLRYWGDIYQRSSFSTVAYWMSQSSEFQNRWGAESDRSYVNQSLYNYLLGRSADKDGLDYWESVAPRVGRHTLAMHWTAQAEVKSKHPVNEPSWCSNGGGPGWSFRSIRGGKVVDVDWTKIDVKASRKRCSVASINANWLELPSASPINMAIVDSHVLNAADGRDRGVFGERWATTKPTGPGVIDDWSKSVLTDYIMYKGNQSLEHESNYYKSNTQRWRWAVSGISLITGGDVSSHLATISRGDYTHGTNRHSFIATKGTTVTFGSTELMNAWDLVAWAQSEGYTNLIKMDGGGSVEFNAYGKTVVAGTNRDIPVWLGIGC